MGRKGYIQSNLYANIVSKVENNLDSYEEEKEGLIDERDLESLPKKLESQIQVGDFALKELEQYGEKIQGANDKYQSHLLSYLFFLITVFFALILFYFFDFGQLIYMVIGVIVLLVLELLFLLKFETFNLVIDASGENWKNFGKSLLYDLGNINPFIRMLTKKSEHLRLISQFKRKSRYVLQKFGMLEISDVERVVDTFESVSDDERIMFEELSEEIEKLGINADIFELFYYEFQLPNNGEIFQKIKNVNNEFQLLLMTLIKARTIRIDLDAHFDVEILSFTLKSLDNFSLDEVRTRLTDQKIETIKLERHIRRLIDVYFPNHAIQDINDGISFAGISSMEDEYIKRLSSVYNVDPEVLRYLFHSIEPSAKVEVFIDSLKSDDKFLEKLSRFLLREGVIRSNSTPQELVEILKAFPRLPPEALQIKISDYEDAFSFTKGFRDFIKKTGGNHKSSPLSINSVFELCTKETDKVERMFKLSVKITEEFEIDRSPSLPVITKPSETISESLLAIYLYRRQSPFLESICRKIFLHQDSVGILYDYAVLTDTEGTSTEELDKLILKAIYQYDQGKTLNDRYYLQYKEKLGNGILYTSIKSLDSYVINETREQVHDINLKISDVSSLDVFKRSLKGLLNDTLIASKIESLLDYGTVNAFLLTKDPKSEGNVLPLIDEIAEKYNIFLEKGSGAHTRFGMIPFGTTFEEFTDRFEGLYNREVYIEGNENVLSSTTLNLYKFVPSKSFTKVIGVNRESYVIEAIGEIIKRDEFPSLDKISILSSLTGESNIQRSVGRIITDAINRINIIEFAIGKASMEDFNLSVLSKVSIENKRKFNNDLLHYFSVETVSALSKSIYKGVAENKDRIYKKFENGVNMALNRYNKSKELTEDVEFIFKEIESLGRVLDTI